MLPRAVSRALARFGLAQPGAAPFPRQLRPMEIHLVGTPFNDPDWVFEPKWDGFRVVATIHNGTVRLHSRNQYPFTDQFRPITEALRDFPTSLVLDGEAVAIDERGLPDFEALQQRLWPRKGRLRGHLTYIVFDCLYLNGHSLLARGLEDRQAILGALGPAFLPETIRVSEALSGVDGTLVFRQCAKLGLEGVIAKRRASVYRPGRRTRDWVKIPIRRREEFVVGGYQMSRPGHLGALVVGQYNRAGILRYAGLVGTGLSEESRRMILRHLQATQRKSCPFVPVPTLRDQFGELRTDLPPHWVRPTIVVEVEYRQRTADGLRHPVLKGLRPDKDVRERLSGIKKA
jgi:bifunctional non-homologous end joining protein LigD